MNKPSESNWNRIDTMTDDNIDTSDIPPLSETFLQRAILHIPKRTGSLTLSIDADVLAWFKAQGDDYEQRINAALRIYMEAHKAAMEQD